jgi:glycosyltransferase involved in cell wall biosynthesis
MLPDEFTNVELAGALETLWQKGERRKQLGCRAREIIRTYHNPCSCADQYAQSIEAIYQRAATDQHALVKAVAALDKLPSNDAALGLVANSVAASCMPEPLQQQLLVDVSSITKNDLKAGIERVVRAQLLELIKHPPRGFRVEPVYLTDVGGRSHYRYARSYTCKQLGIEQVNLPDAPIDLCPGDVFYAADYCPNDVIKAAKSNVYSKWKAAGLSINVLVFDLLPILRPEFFPDGASITHAVWLKAVTESASRLICISNAVADELRLWLENNAPMRKEPLLIDVVHLGADIKASAPSAGLPEHAEELLHKIGATPTFIMVGTIEPRKGHLQTMAAFERVWHEGHQVNLVIVGNEGWTHLPNSQRRTIPEIVDRLRKHPELGRRLFWLEGISDEILLNLYGRADALLMASEGEGFGLPLIEAAQHGLPIIARDLPVFREAAGDHAFYFTGDNAEDLANSIKKWLSLASRREVPCSEGIPRLTWEESTQALLAVLFDCTAKQNNN